MAAWRIYYGNGSIVGGETAAEWAAAPDAGVQVVVLMEPPGVPHWTYERGTRLVTDRQLWTGEDEYDPFGWGPKRGSWMAAGAYTGLWDRACSD